MGRLKFERPNIFRSGMDSMQGRSSRELNFPLDRGLKLIFVSLLLFAGPAPAQVQYVARFTLEKEKFIAGEPIFCVFTIQNTGSRPFAFSYRAPSRALNRELEPEPRFVATQENGHRLPDPAPKPCGGARGSVVYGFVTLPGGQTHTERWLLNQWARVSRPGRYHLRAERRLPLREVDPATQQFSTRPAAFAWAADEFSFEVVPSKKAELEAVFRPYSQALDDPGGANFSEAMQVVTTLPQPFLLAKLAGLATAPERGARAWDRNQALEGLARLGTPAAWKAILETARGKAPAAGPAPRQAAGRAGVDSLRAYAVLLLGEKADAAFIPPLLEMLTTAPEDFRGDVLRALGFFREPRANQVLFDKLHAARSSDRVNAILGLKNLESKDTVPALLAMLNDSDAEVRQVAHFALRSLTGQKFNLSPTASRAESARVSKLWHAWWQEHNGSFVPVRQPACHDW